MKKIYIISQKEVSSFFSSAMGYIIIGVFILINSLFLWIFKGDYNLLDNGFGELSVFFELAPWILIFLIPSITMKSLSEEMKSGTIEILLTRPITYRELVLGKFIGALVPVFLSLVFTFFYVYSIWKLGDPPGNIPIGATIGSYIGLGLLSMCFVSLGILASSFSDNQVVSYLLALFMSFFIYYGLEGFSELGWNNYFLDYLSLKSHFQSIERGLIDTRDLVYFLSLTFLFLGLAEIKIKRRITR